MLSADDLQYFLAVVRHGRVVRAARALQVDHTTVGRRINALEREIGQRLFDRNPRGWELTESGQRLLGPAEQVATAVDLAQETLGGGGTRLTGNVRVLAPDGFGAYLLAPSLGALRRAHPDLAIEIVTATAHLAQSVRTFDVAVTLERPSSERVETRELAQYALGLYASRTYLEEHPRPETLEDLRDHDLIWYIDQLLDVAPLRTVHDVLPAPTVVQSTNLVAHLHAAVGGVGIAPLPKFIAHREADLVPVLPDVEFWGTYWLVLPREHRRLARVRAVVTAIDEIVDCNRTQLLGGPTTGGPAASD